MVLWFISHMERPKKLFQPIALEGQFDDPGGTPPTFTPLRALWTPVPSLDTKQTSLHHRTVPDRRRTRDILQHCFEAIKVDIRFNLELLETMAALPYLG